MQQIEFGNNEGMNKEIAGPDDGDIASLMMDLFELCVCKKVGLASSPALLL